MKRLMDLLLFLRHLLVESYFLFKEMKRLILKFALFILLMASMVVCCEQAQDKEKNAEKYKKLNELDKEDSIGDGVRKQNLCWSCDRD